jgi:hypothetical protein
VAKLKIYIYNTFAFICAISFDVLVKARLEMNDGISSVACF